MIDPSTTIAVSVAAMLLLVMLLGLGRGENTPAACPICGTRSSKHGERPSKRRSDKRTLRLWHPAVAGKRYRRDVASIGFLLHPRHTQGAAWRSRKG